jgi:hypothetical protein
MYTYLLTLFKGHYVEDHEYIDWLSYLLQNVGIRQAAGSIPAVINRWLRHLKSMQGGQWRWKSQLDICFFWLLRTDIQ